MNILISGDNGLIGAQLLQNLKKHKSIYLYTINRDYNITDVSMNEFVNTDNLFFDIFLNLAFSRSENVSELFFSLLLLKNVLDLESCKKSSVINISSQSLYGKERVTISDDNSTVNVDSTYRFDN